VGTLIIRIRSAVSRIVQLRNREVVMVNEDRKELIRNKILTEIIGIATDYGLLKDIFQDNVDDEEIKLSEEEEEYAYDLIDKFTEDEEIRIQVEEIITEFFDQNI
jgi:hypothetical protein